MTLADTFTLELRGLLMGAGTAFPFADKPLEGFGTLSYRGEAIDRAGAHGQLPPRQLLSGRVMRWALNVLADDGVDAEALLADFAAAVAPVDPDLDGGDTIELLVRLGGDRTYAAEGVVTRTAGDLTFLPQHTPLVDVEFLATDPRFYDVDAHAVEVAPFESTGGLELPHDLPHGFGSATSGATVVTNAGNVSTFPTMTIEAGAGGLSSPSYELAETGERMELTLAMAEGDVLTIDHRARTITLEGAGSRATTLDRAASTWFALRPGDSTVTFTGTGEGTLTVAWRDAFLL